MSDITRSLAAIVGEDYVSDQPEEAYFYARDPGLMPPNKPDYVVIPKTPEEIQGIVRLSNKEKIPIIPMGAGLALTGLIIPLKGGIVIDMKHMNRILEVYAYRISLDVWIFLAAGATALILAVATVSYQSIKAALANPVETLRYE